MIAGFIPLLVGAAFFRIRSDGLGFTVGYITGLLLVVAGAPLLIGLVATFG
ncbi:hypothetical protein [Halorarum salinum]|uniref:Uncharacterized protein n=1 Tax=Halorarum salinum TaxID=2743089 RepID=A0A7D5LAM9_9EURY|nr:hypothetical protein [Halobaculum salinum]QLG61967.1 hypothetical protein HUG12_09640 [Halobaculum salinum]